MKNFTLLIFVFSITSLRAQISPFEKSSGRKSATYQEAITWYKDLDKKSNLVSVVEKDQTDANYPLHLVLISADGKFNPANWHHQKKVVIMINNGIHPGEPDGIDASIMLVRDIVNKKLRLPDNVVIGLIPVYNIGGALNRNSTTRVNQNGPDEHGFRGNSQNLDLNRDFTKSDSRESKSFAQIFHFLDPDIFIDNHVSDGADYQHTMTLITTQYNKLGPLGSFLLNEFEPAVYKSMFHKKWEMIPYLEFSSLDFNKKMLMFNEGPRYSTGYAALFNTMGFMPETHMLKPYRERVTATYDLMVSFIDESGKNANKIKLERAKAKQQALLQTDFPLSWKPDTSQSIRISFKGYEQKYKRSEATGLQRMYFDQNAPYTRDLHFVNTFQPANLVKKPTAYIIPQGWHRVLELLKINGVKTYPLKNDTTIEVKAYRIESFKSFPNPYESHHKNYNVMVRDSIIKKKFLKGDHIIYLNQNANRYIVEMLEPSGDDSFFAWNYFDGILQQKEGYSDYRWEDIAAQELRANPDLQQKLAKKKAADPKFAANSREILEFIYKNTKYYEAAHLQYPVYRLESAK